MSSSRLLALVWPYGRYAIPFSLAVKVVRAGDFRDLEIEQYISVFEDIGYLVEGNLIIGKMAYNEFSYDLEKAWCNADVQRVVTDARKADKSVTRQTEPFFRQFEKLARGYLDREGETCQDLDNQLPNPRASPSHVQQPHFIGCQSWRQSRERLGPPIVRAVARSASRRHCRNSVACRKAGHFFCGATGGLPTPEKAL